MPFYEGDTKNYRKDIKFLKGKQRCLICGNVNNWKCRVRGDRLLGLCSYNSNIDGNKDRFGRYIHNLENEKEYVSSQVLQEVETTSQNTEKLRDAVYLNDVYSRYLETLTLDSAHKENLLNRGLSEEDITQNEYKSVPNYNDRYSQIADLVTEFDLEGVPGFYLDGEDWCIHLTFSGFYIPCRDIDGNIIGLQIRRDDDDDDDKKYMWFSSGGKNKGTSSGAPFHFLYPERVDFSDDFPKCVYLTEGLLKADIIAAESGFPLIAMGGANISPKKVSEVIYDSFPNIESIIVAFDADWRTKIEVKSSLIKLLNELKDDTVEVTVAVWDEFFGKGLDDVFTNKNYHNDMVEFISVEDFLKAESGNGGDEPPTPVQSEADDELPFEDNNIIAEDNDFLFSWDEFSRANFNEIEKVIFGLVRGNVGMMVAPTNIGKTSYCLNLALSVTAQKEFLPVFSKQNIAKRVLYIDGEATKAELQADIKTMLNGFEETERDLVSENLFLICDEELNDEPLDLANPEHYRKIENAALNCKADLIVVDTLSALMDIEDENDNAKVKKEVMKPLKKLAKKTNSAVLLLHHSGKYQEDASKGVYRGRGASALPSLSRIVLNLERDKSGENRVVLACSKVKGKVFRKTILELNPQSRWFSTIELEKKEEQASRYEKIIDFVCNNGNEAKRIDILNALEIDDSTLDRDLDKAVEVQDLEKVGHGKYKCSNTQHNHQELALGE